MPRAFPTLRALLLTGLAGWAGVLALETWWRAPGGIGDGGLPPRIAREGHVWMRAQASPLAARLPEGLALVEAADYGPIRLLRLVLASSGTGVSMPVEAIAPAVLGEGGRGRCVVLRADGSIARELPTDAAWQAWMAGRAPGGAQWWAWLAGLRPYRANECVWESRP